MLGAIAGDICGSPYEGGSCSPARFELFGFGTYFTDDTVCTVAIAEALLDGTDIAATLKKWVCRYPGRGYGGQFYTWATSLGGPYNSFGNGGAMRVSPVALLATSLDEVLARARATAEVSHNHPEGVRGAQAIAAAIWWARQGADQSTLRKNLAQFGYDLRPTVAAMAADFGFTTLAEETVPIALICALEATSWDDAIRKAVEVGGDSDTTACMAGGIAEALFGFPACHATATFEALLPTCWIPIRRSHSLGMPLQGPRLYPSLRNPSGAG